MNKEVKYLKEHLYEIYKYKKSMKDLTYDMNIELLLRTCKALDYQQQRIDKAIEYMENELIPENPNWEFNEVICSDLPLERIKPLYDILKGGSNGNI